MKFTASRYVLPISLLATTAAIQISIEANLKTRIPSLFLSSLKLTASRGSYPACVFMIAFAMGLPAHAATISFSYSFTGGPVGPEVMSGTILTVDHLSTGSVLSSSPSLNAIWNPFTLLSHDVVDFAALTLNGDSTITFADGSTLFCHQFVDFANPLVPETLTFTGGTGEFAGATGSWSGESALLPNGFTVSGAGTINAPAIAPEPASFAPIIGGLLVMAGSRNWSGNGVEVVLRGGVAS